MLKERTRRLDITYLIDMRRILESKLMRYKFDSYYARKNSNLERQTYLDNEIEKIQGLLKDINHKIAMSSIPCVSDEELSLKPMETRDMGYEIVLSNTKEVIGKIDYRGHHYDAKIGDIGYHIYEKYRGHNYAYKALCLISGLLASQGIEDFWISARPDNLASIKTIEKFGGEIIECSDDVFLYACETKTSIHKRVNKQD